MRRIRAMLSVTVLVLAAGCGGRIYEARLEKTLDQMRYQMKLDQNLTPAPTKGKLEQNLIYVRPPKNLQGPAKDFQLTVLEPGKFDLAESFFEQNVQNMHILARVKRPKDPTKKAAPEPANRGEFVPDVIAVLNGVYSQDIDPVKAKEDKKKNNTFKKLEFEGNGKTVRVYFYGGKATQYEVALIFEFAKAQQAAVATRIELCLESFETGERARRAYTGKIDEEGAEETGSPAVF